jgi:phage gp16-like protein
MSIVPDRRARIAKIHIAKKELALEDDSYRAMLMRVTGKSSSTHCDIAQLDAVLAEFRRLGFASAKPRAKTAHDRPLSERAYVRMIFGLWKDLKPHLTDSSHKALCSFVKRQTGIENPEWLAPEDGGAVIEALKDWLERCERGAEAGGNAARAGIVTPRARRRARRAPLGGA